MNNNFSSFIKKNIKSDTAKDTFIVVFSKFAIAFLGLLFTIITSRKFSIEAFGVFSSIENQILMLLSIADVGMSAGIINYLSNKNLQANKKNRITKSFFVAKTLFFAFLLFTQILFGKSNLPSFWLISIGIVYTLLQFAAAVLNGKKLFKNAAIVETSNAITKLIAVILLIAFLPFQKNIILISFLIGLIFATLKGFKYVKFSFISQPISMKDIKNLILFSGPIGIFKVLSSVADKIDIQAVSTIQGLEAAGIYSIGFKLAIFIQTIALAYTLTLSSRFVNFSHSKEYQKSIAYLKKALNSIVPLIMGILLVLIISPSIITLIFGQKYIQSIQVFKILALSRTLALIRAPHTAAIIYALKKPKILIYATIVRFAIVYFGNYVLISNPTINTPAILSLIGYFASTIIILYYTKKEFSQFAKT